MNSRNVEFLKFCNAVTQGAGTDMHISQPRNLTLRFKSGLPEEILTGLDVNGGEVELVDDTTGEVVKSGPEACADVEIVALDGHQGGAENWTTEEFNNKIASETDFQELLLGGNLNFKLKEGSGLVGTFKFRHYKKWTKPRRLLLGARIRRNPTGVRITEAKTEPFTLKDRRNTNYSKPDKLALDDKVYRMKNISYKGKIWPKLQQEQVFSVKDFLTRLFKDPEELKRLVDLREREWEETLNHAEKGMIDGKICCYTDPDGKKMVGFNFVGQLLGAYLVDRWQLLEELTDHHKESARELVVQALNNWTDVEFVDSEASLKQKFPPFYASVNPLNSHQQEELSLWDLESRMMDDEPTASDVDEDAIEMMHPLCQFILYTPLK